jgi:hypothetical protein
MEAAWRIFVVDCGRRDGGDAAARYRELDAEDRSD